MHPLLTGLLGGSTQFQSSIPLLQGLVSYWRLNEAGGPRADAHGVNHLTDNNTTLSATGKQGDAAAFVAASNQYLSRASNASLQTGDIDFEIVGWFKATTLAGNNDLLGKLATAGEFEWFIEIGSATNFRFGVSSNGSSITGDLNVTVPAFSTGTWYFFDCWHDSVGNTVNFKINNGTTQTLSYSGGVRAGASAFDIGRGVSVRYWDGLIDEVGFWKRTLTVAERTQLYNGGAGTSYPFA